MQNAQELSTEAVRLVADLCATKMASGDEPTREAVRLIADLYALGKRARYMAEVRTVTKLMRVGGRPAQWLPLNVLEEFKRIGLVQMLAGGACKLTPIGVEAARWFENEARKAYPSTPDRLLDAAMARVMRDE